MPLLGQSVVVPYVDLGPISHPSIKKGVSISVTYTFQNISIIALIVHVSLARAFAPIPLLGRPTKT